MLEDQLLVAVAKDPNDWYFPLTVAIVKAKIEKTQIWFLDIILGDVNGQRR